MVDDRLNGIVRQLRAVGEEHDRAVAEEQRRVEEEAQRKLLVERGWHRLRGRREGVVDELNLVLQETGFQLHVAADFVSEHADEIDYFIVSFRGKQHPKFEHVRLRVSLKEDGMVVADVITDGASKRLKRLTYEEFTIDTWRGILLDHLELLVTNPQ